MTYDEWLKRATYRDFLQTQERIKQLESANERMSVLIDHAIETCENMNGFPIWQLRSEIDRLANKLREYR